MDDSAYKTIAGKYEEQDPHTAPKDETGAVHPAFVEYLKILYTPEQAEIIQHLNVFDALMTTREAAEASGKSLEEVERVLQDAYERNRVVGLDGFYCLPPIPLLVNINHFYPEVKSGDVESARLHTEYFVKGGFYKLYESSKAGTPMGRVIPVSRAIEANQVVLAAEEAHDFIMHHSAEEMALVPCPCRTRTEKLGNRECKDEFPIGACIMLGFAALHFEHLGLGKLVTKEQAIEYYDEMVELGLVGHTFNARYGDMLICLCCGCCCSQVRGRLDWDNPNALAPSNFIPKAGDDCVGCETCTERCYFKAIRLGESSGVIEVDIEKCIGCGLCTLACPQETLKLHRYERTKTFDTSKILLDTVFKENREG